MEVGGFALRVDPDTGVLRARAAPDVVPDVDEDADAAAIAEELLAGETVVAPAAPSLIASVWRAVRAWDEGGER